MDGLNIAVPMCLQNYVSGRNCHILVTSYKFFGHRLFLYFIATVLQIILRNLRNHCHSPRFFTLKHVYAYSM